MHAVFPINLKLGLFFHRFSQQTILASANNPLPPLGSSFNISSPLKKPRGSLLVTFVWLTLSDLSLKENKFSLFASRVITLTRICENHVINAKINAINVPGKSLTSLELQLV